MSRYVLLSLGSALLVCACSLVSGLDDFAIESGSGAGGGAGAGGEGGGGAGGGAGAGAVGGAGGANAGGGGANVGGGVEPCGDGEVAAGEECDDGNTTDGDGCDGSCVVECPGIKHPNTFHCYFFVTQSVAWQTAEDACVSRGAGWHLAAVSSAQERNFLDNQAVVPSQCWLGGRDPNGDDVFEWTNGEPWDFNVWNPGNPDAGIQCVTFYKYGGASDDVLVDRLCGELWPRLCELTPAGR